MTAGEQSSRPLLHMSPPCNRGGHFSQSYRPQQEQATATAKQAEDGVTYADFKKLVDVNDPVGCIIGHYDYVSLCRPRWPFCRSPGTHLQSQAPSFFPVTEPLPWLLAILLGFQHSVAMVGGIIVPPIIIAATQSDISVRSYCVSASLITSGIGSIIQCMRWKIPGTKYFYGTGLITVVGTGMQQLQVVVAGLQQQTKDGVDWADAYGRLLGTLAISSITVILISFLPPKAMDRLFPPWIAGLTVFVGGVNLIGVGMKNWGGGSECADGNTLCKGNGNVILPFGSAAYIGIGASVFLSIMIIEVWGSPFLRNIQIVAGFLVGYGVAALCSAEDRTFINNDAIDNTSSFQFLWTKTFRLGFYPAALLPTVIAFAVDAVNTVGDITSSEEASGLATFGPEHDAHLQGGLLADGVNSLFASLSGVMPVLVYAQNNGVISFTMVASRIAGTFCGAWLLLFGVLGKLGAFLANAPNCVLGGMQVCIFSTVGIAGIRLMMMTNFNRRIRFIQVMAGGVGLGATLVPNWGVTLWPLTDDMNILTKSICNSVSILMGTGFALAFLVAVILHNILPEEEDPHILREASQRNILAWSRSSLNDVQLAESPEAHPLKAPELSI